MRVSAYVLSYCFGDYLQDHHNRAGECMIGVYPSGQDRAGIIRDALEELRSTDYGIPDTVTDETIRSALTETLSPHAILAPVDDSGTEVYDRDRFDDLPDEQPQLWIVLKWSED